MKLSPDALAYMARAIDIPEHVKRLFELPAEMKALAAQIKADNELMACAVALSNTKDI